ncbi:NAD-dependent epimerase/dehydratase family protein [Pseudomonas oryzihabitans]|uniref:NAD-dependent epimerase/dehydratase family protein n=1 Tax=Pseudomonas oryzihabitans TaxID=47885 RepID=UPI0021B63574|nr:NAD(P)-dependent oxidoreductase [Pseudomonas oryzihabitans]
MKMSPAEAELRTAQECLARLQIPFGALSALAGTQLVLTGGTGFFGKWLLSALGRLNEQGTPVMVTVVSRSPEAFLRHFPSYRQATWLSWLTADLGTVDALRLPPADFVIHAAADSSGQAQADRHRYAASLLRGAMAVFDAAGRAGARRVLLTGSGAQYGARQGPVREDHRGAPLSHLPTSLYAEGKRMVETLAAIGGERYGYDVISTRCFAFAGPWLPLNGHFAFGNFIRDALQAPHIRVNSAGTAQRSYLAGADLAVWLLLLLLRGEAGQPYNVGSDQSLSIRDLAGRIGHLLAPDKAIQFAETDQACPVADCYVPDITKARSLGLEVWTTLDTVIHDSARAAGTLP